MKLSPLTICTCPQVDRRGEREEAAVRVVADDEDRQAELRERDQLLESARAGARPQVQ